MAGPRPSFGAGSAQYTGEASRSSFGVISHLLFHLPLVSSLTQCRSSEFMLVTFNWCNKHVPAPHITNTLIALLSLCRAVNGVNTPCRPSGAFQLPHVAPQWAGFCPPLLHHLPQWHSLWAKVPHPFNFTIAGWHLLPHFCCNALPVPNLILGHYPSFAIYTFVPPCHSLHFVAMLLCFVVTAYHVICVDLYTGGSNARAVCGTLIMLVLPEFGLRRSDQWWVWRGSAVLLLPCCPCAGGCWSVSVANSAVFVSC